MTQAGGYALAEALGRANQASSSSLVVKTKAANAAQNIYLKIVDFWQRQLQNDANNNVDSSHFQADDNSANAAQAPANSLVQTEEGVAAQVPQNTANIIRSCTDIIGLFSFVAQLQSSQS